MDARLIDVESGTFTLCLGIEVRVSDLDAVRMAFEAFREDSAEQAHLAEGFGTMGRTSWSAG